MVISSYNRSGGRGGSMGAVDSMGGMDPTAELGFLSKLVEGLPPWAVALLTVLTVLVAAWIVGIIIGKLYSMVRYPDPEKHNVIPPIVKVGFICAVAAGSIWLYSTLTKVPEVDMAVDGDSMVEPIGPGMPGGDMIPGMKGDGATGLDSTAPEEGTDASSDSSSDASSVASSVAPTTDAPATPMPAPAESKPRLG